MPIYPGAFEAEDIPSERVFLALHYSRTAGSLVTHFEVNGRGGLRVKRLFARPVAGGRYAPIAVPGDEMSQEAVVFAEGTPLLFVNELNVSLHGYDWSRLRSVNLTSGDHATLLTPETIPREPQDLRAWISDLIVSNPDGSRVVCTRAREEPRAPGNTQVVYEVVELDVASRSIRVITELKNTFF